jgi:DNA-binding CsgD family transcriptional regulator
VDEAVNASEGLRRHAADLPGAAQLLSSALAGRAALGAGRLDTACALLEPAVELIFAVGDTNGFGYQYHLPRTIALAMRGSAVEATAALAALAEHRYPSWRYLDYSYAIAEAWVTACNGAVGEAAGMALIAAETACLRGQFAAEVACLQTAVQFGDTSVRSRLRQLEAIVDGPRCGAVARFAEALRDDDGDALAAVSEQFEQMGDVVAAVDASAYAATAYRRQNVRGPSFACSIRAERLAERCGGARTPALRHGTEPLPLTNREREIVVLLGAGLSSAAVAERLVLSVRTVESHIYKAMAKTGTGSRDALAALIPR